MVYLIENERLFLITHNLINLILPVFVLFVGIYVIAELNDQSLFPKSVENPYFFLIFLSVWFSFAYFMATRVRKSTIFRIYYNQKEDKFAFIRMKGLLKFEKEDFVRQNVYLRAVASNQNEFIKNITRNFGNVYINNTLRQIDFKLFSSNEVIQKMVGKKQFEYLKKKQIIQN